ncbi:MAG: hypothetical protein FWD46_04955 [Cystobacterineae bacterium]|nr:hypothetical protein [Cystobacterineae bacterium]
MGGVSGLLNLRQGVGGVLKTLGLRGGEGGLKTTLPANLLDKFEGAAAPAPAPSYEERYAQAVHMLDVYFDVLDTAAGKGKKDGKISKKDLEAALKNPSLPQELRDACRFLLENKDAFRKLDVGAGKGGHDGIISKKDVAAVLTKLPAELRVFAPTDSRYKADLAVALNMIYLYFDMLDTAAGKGKADGKISKKDLEAALKNPSLPQELRDACRFLLDNPAVFNQLDVGAGKGSCDGIISRKDVAMVLEKLPATPQEMTAEYQSYWAEFRNALSMLNLYFDMLDTAAGKGKKDGKISRKDLEAAMNNPAFPKELREACRFLLNNPAAFNRLDIAAGIGRCDGIIGKKDVAAALNIGKTGLGDEVDALVALSPSLLTDLQRLKNEGWKIVYGTSGGGSYCTPNKKTIVIDIQYKGKPDYVVEILAHEVGHATYVTGKMDISSKKAYAESRVVTEGAAILNAIKVQREIEANGGKYEHNYNRTLYYEIYDQYLMDGDVDKARKDIGLFLLDHEVTSSSKGKKTYRQTYDEEYDKYYGNAFKRFFARLFGY